MHLSESEIIAGCLRKKRKAQKALYDQYHPVLLGICLRYAKSRAEAEDVLLMAFTRIYKKIDTYTGDGSFEGWMKRIVINIAIDNYRKNAKHYFHDELEDVPQSELGFDFIPDSFALRDILKTIQELPDGYRMVFNLYAIEGYPHKEIAEKLGISESTSKTQLLKARKRLQQKLVQYQVTEVTAKTKKKIKVEWRSAL
jgi:RNA polymerase sigma-70 factor (ECF subfamily)